MNIVLAENGSFYCNIQGNAEGTSYNIIYQDDECRNFKDTIDCLLKEFEKSLSVYDKESIISQINNNQDVELDDYFIHVFNRAKEIWKITEGAFDISAEPLFKAWGFSAGEKVKLDDKQIKILKKDIGLDKIHIIEKRIIKSSPNIQLNVNAIAKGYSADIVAKLLEEHGISDYLVEIGGEIRLKGNNTEGEAWRIGIDRPSDDNPIPGQNLQAILQITNKGVATSGNYRQFYEQDGKRINHTINPATGYPVEHNLLSTTVVAPDTITADALATAFMVGGMDKALEWIEQLNEVEAIFICNEDNELKVYCTQELQDKIKID